MASFFKNLFSGLAAIFGRRPAAERWKPSDFGEYDIAEPFGAQLPDPESELKPEPESEFLLPATALEFRSREAELRAGEINEKEGFLSQAKACEERAAGKRAEAGNPRLSLAQQELARREALALDGQAGELRGIASCRMRPYAMMVRVGELKEELLSREAVKILSTGVVVHKKVLSTHEETGLPHEQRCLVFFDGTPVAITFREFPETVDHPTEFVEKWTPGYDTPDTVPKQVPTGRLSLVAESATNKFPDFTQEELEALLAYEEQQGELELPSVLKPIKFGQS